MRLSSSQWNGTKAVKRRRGTLGDGTIFHICCPDHKGPGVPASRSAHVAIGRAHTDSMHGRPGASRSQVVVAAAMGASRDPSFFFRAGGSPPSERADGLMTLDDHCLATRHSPLATINRRGTLGETVGAREDLRERCLGCAQGNKEVRIRLAI